MSRRVEVGESYLVISAHAERLRIADRALELFPRAYSPEFASCIFSEVRGFRGYVACFCAVRHILLWSTYLFLTQEYAAFVTWPSRRYVKAQDSYLSSS